MASGYTSHLDRRETVVVAEKRETACGTASCSRRVVDLMAAVLVAEAGSMEALDVKSRPSVGSISIAEKKCR